MKNSFGNLFCVTLFGESHQRAIGAVVDGVPPGLLIDENEIKNLLEKRRGLALASTARREKDNFQLVSGVCDGRATGAPVCIIIENSDIQSGAYEEAKNLARPSHADYTAFVKYGGFADCRGTGHFSGRLTAPLVAVGSIAMQILKQRGIFVSSHILSCGGVKDRHFGLFEDDFKKIESLDFPVLDEEKRSEMLQKITLAKNEGDSLGGTVETAVIGLPTGLGEPWFDTVEGVLSHGLFSIPAVKGVAFGSGFDFADMKGSKANDELFVEGEKIKTSTNRSGGVNGGITNSMPLTLTLAVKPTPSIFKEQSTVDFVKKTNEKIKLSGRHDPTLVHKICPIASCVTAIALCDLLFQSDAYNQKENRL